MQFHLIYPLIFLNFVINVWQLGAQNQTLPNKIAPILPKIHSKLPSSLRVKLSQPLEFEKWCKSQLKNLSIQQKFADNSILLLENINSETFKKLQECPYIQFIDVGKRLAKEERENDLAGFQVNRVSALRSQFPQLTGAGMGISIKESPFDKNDIDFRGRVANFANFPTNATTHATIMTSLIGGGGNSTPLAQGVAWQAQLFTSDFANLMPDNGTSLLNQGVSVQNHSYGVGIENYYGIETQAYDQECSLNPSLLHIFSAGNSGTLTSQAGPYAGIAGFANLTAQFKMSKNTLSIGEISQENLIKPLSSRGPAYDGRVKPELVAYGGAGSSESSALVSGVALLVQQAYQLKFNALPPASLVKSALINSADDLGRPEVDFEYGYGKLDALGAVQIIDNEQFIHSNLSPNQTRQYSIQVPANTRKLKITLVWHDPVANLNANQALVNDLDISLLYPNSNQTWLPWGLNSFANADSLRKNAVRKVDRLNNIEQITLDFPLAGMYEIKVKAFGLQTDNQDFSITYEFENGIRWLYPNPNDYLEAGKTLTLEWLWQTTPAAGQLQFRYASENTWQTLAQINDLSIGKWNWELPDTSAVVQWRLLFDSQELLSEFVPIVQPITPKVGFNCESALMLLWDKLPAIAQYQVYRLGEKFLEPLVSTQDTFLIINKLQENTLHFAVAPQLANQWLRGRAINYTQQGTNCYFRSLQVREIINDTIYLNLELGTSYQLRQIALQRKQNGVFQTIHSINNPLRATWLLADSLPQPFINFYRVELTDNQGLKYYSDEVFAYYLPKDEFLLAPNPVKLGEDLTLLDEEEQVESVQIITALGKLALETPLGFGSFKYISTEQLTSGVYFLRFKTLSGKMVVKRFIVY
jgi:hypothetical protein